MLVLAGPGSGKTKVLTERIRVLIEDNNIAPENILVITFSQKAALEMRQRFNRLAYPKSYPVNFGTFHSIFYRILKSFEKYSDISIISSKDKCKFIMEIGEAMGIERASYFDWQNDILTKISYVKNNNIDDNDEIYNDHFREIIDKYKNKCISDRKIDFDDILILCREELYKHEMALRKWQSIYKYILVDEFQDINSIQYDILRLLAGDKRNVFCVGDDDQSIYSFRGADPSFLQKFTNQFAYCKVVNLSVNYRCAYNIVGASNTLIMNNKERIKRPMQEVFNNRSNGNVYVLSNENTIKQAELVCDIIESLVRDGECLYSDCAILYRSSHCAKMFEDVARKRNIPVIVSENNFNLFECKEIKVLMSYMKIAAGKADRSDYLRAVNNPTRGISREAFNTASDDYMTSMYKYYQNTDKEKVIKELVYHIKYIRDYPPYAFAVYILEATGLREYLQKNYKSNNNCNYQFEEIVSRFLDVARNFETLSGFINYLEQVEEADDENGRKLVGDDKNGRDYIKGVCLMTAHASKGLEFKTVFIIGLQEGLFPHNKNLHGSSVEEERRLMYVAMTRAKENLYLCALDIEHGKQKSRFIDEINANQSFISSYSSLSRNSSKASATASYSSSSSI